MAEFYMPEKFHSAFKEIKRLKATENKPALITVALLLY